MLPDKKLTFAAVGLFLFIDCEVNRAGSLTLMTVVCRERNISTGGRSFLYPFSKEGDAYGTDRIGKWELFQVEGDSQIKIWDELHITARYTSDNKLAKSLVKSDRKDPDII